MALEGIRRRPYPEADRNEVQERVARAIEADPGLFFARYAAHPQSFEGFFGPGAIAQARGLAPLARHAELHPPDGREPADARPGRAQGAARETVGGSEAARAEGA